MSLYVKFTSLLAKTVSKPIANAIKAQAKEHETFRKVCIQFAQRVHQADVNVRRRLLGQKDLKVRPLNDKKAIQSGANFLADSFVFAIGGGLILFEYQRSKRKEAKRRADLDDDIRVLQDEVDWLVYQLKLKGTLEKDYVVPDDAKTTILHLRRQDGTDTNDRDDAKEEESREKSKGEPKGEPTGRLDDNSKSAATVNSARADTGSQNKEIKSESSAKVETSASGTA